MKFKNILFLVFFFGFLPHFGVLAKETDATFFATAWTSKCQEFPPSKEKICVLEKYLFEDKNQRNRISGIGVRTSNQNKNTVMTIISPLGIALNPGVEIGFGGEKSNTYPFLFCDNGGCVSQFTVDDKMIGLLSNRKEMTLTYSLLSGRKIVINVDLENFKSLYSGIKQ